ncbi:hypothetical protein FNW02_21560 [Komarekiella sp. 'clone 1']|uniref:Uncharacterized protein n=1 Tax=Komarekiella delphini-convector SJRDD-AB1 TaxID=2593771 RepID=A0AA40T0B2_9NOST|nr:hypothetical protein [Komarekiella delphini-convector SJRDD-AB1]
MTVDCVGASFITYREGMGFPDAFLENIVYSVGIPYSRTSFKKTESSRESYLFVTKALPIYV